MKSTTKKQPMQKVIVIGGMANNFFCKEVCRLCGNVFDAGAYLFSLHLPPLIWREELYERHQPTKETDIHREFGHVCYDCAENPEKIPARVLKFAAELPRSVRDRHRETEIALALWYQELNAKHGFSACKFVTKEVPNEFKNGLARKEPDSILKQREEFRKMVLESVNAKR